MQPTGHAMALMAMALVFGSASASFSQTASVDHASIWRAVPAGLRYLKGAQQEDGSWQCRGGEPDLQATALALLALEVGDGRQWPIYQLPKPTLVQ